MPDGQPTPVSVDVKPGETTSEFAETKKTNTIAVVIMAVGGLLEILHHVSEGLGAATPDWLGKILVIGGMAMRLASTLGYQTSRARVKAAASDAAAKAATLGKSASGFLLIWLIPCAVLMLTACPTIQQYDPATTQQIQRTIEFEDKDYKASLKVFEARKATKVEKTGLQIRHESEMTRLKTWLAAEESKRTVDD